LQPIMQSLKRLEGTQVLMHLPLHADLIRLFSECQKLKEVLLNFGLFILVLFFDLDGICQCTFPK
jgi:hypothetical protein